MVTRQQHGQRIGRSDLPRISRALAAHLDEARRDRLIDIYNYDDDPSDDYLEDATEDFGMSYSIADPVRRAEGSSIHDEVTEDQAGRMLQNYRKNRNAGQDQEFSREDIRDAYNSRFDY